MGLDESIARLGQAISLYEQTGPLLDDLSELKTAFAYLGAALVLRGSADEGQTTFAELLMLDPSFSLEGFNPLVTKIFDRAVGSNESKPKGTVEIYSTPPNAAVFVDGVYRGVSPITLKDLGFGGHHLRIEKNGYSPYGGPLEVTNEQSLTSQTRLDSITRGAELRDLLARVSESVERGGMDGDLRELARLLLCDALVVVSVSQSGNDISALGGLFDRSSATRIADARAVISSKSDAFRRETKAYLDRIVKSLGELGQGQSPESIAKNNNTSSLSGFGLGEGAGGRTGGNTNTVSNNTGQAPVENVRVPSTQAVDGAPEPTQILGWGLVGLGTAGVITGAVFAGLAKQTHTNFINTSQNSPELPLIQNDGKTQALTADICFGAGGLVTLIGATILTIRSLRRPAPTELLGLNEESNSWPILGYSQKGDGHLISLSGVWP